MQGKYREFCGSGSDSLSRGPQKATDSAGSRGKFPARRNREYFPPNRDPNSSISEIWSTDQGRAWTTQTKLRHPLSDLGFSTRSSLKRVALGTFVTPIFVGGPFLLAGRRRSEDGMGIFGGSVCGRRLWRPTSHDHLRGAPIEGEPSQRHQPNASRRLMQRKTNPLAAQRTTAVVERRARGGEQRLYQSSGHPIQRTRWRRSSHRWPAALSRVSVGRCGAAAATICQIQSKNESRAITGLRELHHLGSALIGTGP